MADGRKAILAKPCHLAAAPAADVGCGPGLEEASNQRLQIGRRRVRMPVVRKGAGMLVIGRQRPQVDHSAIRLRTVTGPAATASPGFFPPITRAATGKRQAAMVMAQLKIRVP